MLTIGSAHLNRGNILEVRAGEDKVSLKIPTCNLKIE